MKLNIFNSNDTQYVHVYVGKSEVDDDFESKISEIRTTYKNVSIFISGTQDIKETFQNIVENVDKCN